jgi:hypothetical protein
LHARFLGTTRNSTDIIPLLQTLLGHIAILYKQSKIYDAAIRASSTADYLELCSVLKKLLEDIPASKPLILFLDSLDQLSTTSRAKNLSFLPRKLQNPNVKIILSTLPDDEYNIWPQLLRMYPELEGGPPHLKVPAWTAADGELVLQASMVKEAFTLTSAQKAHVLERFEGCPTSMYLVLSTYLAKNWTSIEDKTWDPIPRNVHGCIIKVMSSTLISVCYMITRIMNWVDL